MLTFSVVLTTSSDCYKLLHYICICIYTHTIFFTILVALNKQFFNLKLLRRIFCQVSKSNTIVLLYYCIVLLYPESFMICYKAIYNGLI